MTIFCRYLILTDVLPSFTRIQHMEEDLFVHRYVVVFNFCLTMGHDALSDKRGCTLMSASPISPGSFFGQTFSIP